MITIQANIPKSTYNEPNSHGIINYLKDELGENFELEKIIEKVASVFHEKWRNSKMGKPTIEKSEDEDWTKIHGTDIVDIANTKFEDLPSNWKYENIEAAKVAVSLVYKKVVGGEEITSEMIEEMSKIVHEKWLERNGVEGSSESQRVDYEELSEEEKAKDRVQIEIAIQIIKGKK